MLHCCVWDVIFLQHERSVGSLDMDPAMDVPNVKKFFSGNVSERMDFSGFEPCPPRTNEEHREQAEDILEQTSQTDKNLKEHQYGTRYTELMMLPYFDCFKFHIIDPMHNLFTGTAKHIMRNIWLESSSPLIEKKTLKQYSKRLTNLKSLQMWVDKENSKFLWRFYCRPMESMDHYLFHFCIMGYPSRERFRSMAPFCLGL